LVFCAFLINACKKDKKDKNFNAVGFWKGNYSQDPSEPPSPTKVSFALIRPDGTVRWYIGSDTSTNVIDKTTGTYTIESDSIVNVNLPEWDELSRLKIRNNSTKLVGTWGTDPSNDDGGQEEYERQ
ncbi:MAG: hypothetical protein U0T31_11240, partial [Chitinophagales bacterium]